MRAMYCWAIIIGYWLKSTLVLRREEGRRRTSAEETLQVPVNRSPRARMDSQEPVPIS
jgi:hypothetical protein